MSADSTTAYYAVDKGELRADLLRNRSLSWWGMVALILNELMIFSSLFSTYLYVRVNSPVWPQNGIKPAELIIPLIGTVLLLSGSFAMHQAESRITDDEPNPRRIIASLMLTLLLGTIFLGLQLYEYSTSEFTFSANAYASLFFLITGLHGLHVFVGLLMIGTLLLYSLFGESLFKAKSATINITLYWHFVDVVWLIVLTIVYLSPHLG